jgi:hypothetical protein
VTADIFDYDDYLFLGYSWADKARRIVKGEVSDDFLDRTVNR